MRILNSFGFLLQIQRASKFRTYRSYLTLNKETSNLISDTKEIQIPMPYGKLSAKAWGKESGIPVLFLHGLQGNCGHFDRLIPLLNNKFYIVAVDKPGHGLSSHRSVGSLYTEMHEVLDYRRVVDFLGWEKFHVLGNSMGCELGLLLSIIFPNLIKKMVAFDRIKPFSYPLSAFPEATSEYFRKYLEFEKKFFKQPTVYTYEDIFSKLLKRSHIQMSPESAHIHMQRSTRISDCGTGLVHNGDIRSQHYHYSNTLSYELSYQYLSGVKCELLMIMTKSADPLQQTDNPDAMEEVFDIYRRNAKTFKLEYVEGNHLIILNNPERLSPLINNFLSD